MKKITLITALLFTICMARAQAPVCQWVTGNNDAQSNQQLAVDGQGNSYVTGTFIQPITFGATVIDNYDAGHYSPDVYIVKYNTAGHLIWATKGGSELDDANISILSDGGKYVYVGGTFSGTKATFGNVVLNNAHPSTRNADIFLAKYDSSGSVIWAKSIGGAGGETLSAMALNPDGSIIMAATFATPYVMIGADKYYSGGYFVKFDSAGNVVSVWSQINTKGSNRSIAVDSKKQVYFTGSFTDTTATFGTITLTNTRKSFADFYIAKADSLGNVLWVKSGRGAGNEIISAVQSDKNGNVYAGGFFYSKKLIVDSDTLYNTDTSGITCDGFFAEYDSAGNKIWIKQMSGLQNDYAWQIKTDGGGNVYLLSRFNSNSSVTIDGVTLRGYGYGGFFLARFNTSGIMQWAITVDSSYLGNWATALDLDSDGNIYLAGNSGGSFNLDGKSLVNQNFFLTKLLNDVATQAGSAVNLFNAAVYPNPTQGIFNVTTANPTGLTISVINLLGKQVYNKTLTTSQTQIDIHRQPAGLYFYCIKQGGTILQAGKMVKQ